ncbi:hypothetical protein [Actinomadura litoris]|uniref:hypothetical protein n=1 Tax=Actinomadura litoris TaxID=2678616 RepID=UPI001FA6EE01|nr:hypothetical protein [Actinomadura litoris]
MLGLSWETTGGWALSFVLSCGAAACCLELRCRGQHQMFGKVSRPWALAVIGTIGAAATVLGNVTVLMPHPLWGAGASLTAVGALLAGEIRRSVQVKQITESAPTQTMMIASVGIAYLLFRFERSLGDDDVSWAGRCFKDPEWLDGERSREEITAAARFFCQRLRKQVAGGENPDERRRELQRLSDHIHGLVSVAALCEDTDDRASERVLRALELYGLLGGQGYEDRARREDLTDLRGRLLSDAMGEIQRILTCALRWGYKPGLFTGVPLSSTGPDRA